eukprot:CAMPEP_0115852690 /NCGR_PEP_ID=MMETSP0287-20121206/13125_1 /TAXON_ID=412157 /ORGANISM="Chrysochromulina rotalis, Strain UIO044" /LENGTH=108 /DNA_ID=CAMNT_0003306757 /DNA_START=278 /DNA_END=604 /DNA_ORIENTATION=+
MSASSAVAWVPLLFSKCCKASHLRRLGGVWEDLHAAAVLRGAPRTVRARPLRAGAPLVREDGRCLGRLQFASLNGDPGGVLLDKPAQQLVDLLVGAQEEGVGGGPPCQ